MFYKSAKGIRVLGVASVLDNHTVRLAHIIRYDHAMSLVNNDARIEWLLLNDKDNKFVMLMPIAELAKYLQVLMNGDREESELVEIDLLEIPAKRLQPSPISLQANLQQAHEKFEEGSEVLYVVFNEAQIDESTRIYGIITEEMIERAYKPKKQY